MRKGAEFKYSALAMAVLGLSLLGLIWDGKISDFVDPRLVLLIFPAGLACVILAQVVLSASRDEPDAGAATAASQGEGLAGKSSWPGWGLLWISIPFIIGFLFP